MIGQTNFILCVIDAYHYYLPRLLRAFFTGVNFTSATFGAGGRGGQMPSLV
ncbi:hypothetical protein XBP1_2210003 [Xenorhabdus bovienii str. puntauvense]|uniref:Uncharacterized protein n=1 Tax=Xenorhabdus bovienii str. puntauvense TaxID=1398201 RepID=A0A077NCW3_XENBV|nr:hypothetical protein XBP1_2210003 [Xenorhabdus bovienii str. puntauvense]